MIRTSSLYLPRGRTKSIYRHVLQPPSYARRQHVLPVREGDLERSTIHTPLRTPFPLPRQRPFLVGDLQSRTVPLNTDRVLVSLTPVEDVRSCFRFTPQER